jgi:hypothetical protein
MGGTELTWALKAEGVVAGGIGAMSVTPDGRIFWTPIFCGPSSWGSGRFQVMSQFGASVGNAQAAASTASASVPLRERRIEEFIWWESGRAEGLCGLGKEDAP